MHRQQNMKKEKRD